jgi:hypothetical protein
MDKIRELESEVEELTVHLADMLEAVLHFAGVKEEFIQEGVKGYIEVLDEVFDDDEGEMGYKEIIKVVEYLKLKKPILFD